MRTFASDELTEIRDSYRNAADQKKQIGILADLHDCTVQDIQRHSACRLHRPNPSPQRVEGKSGRMCSGRKIR